MILVGSDEVEYASVFFADGQARGFVAVVVTWHVKVDYVRDVLDHRSLRVACVQHHKNVKLSDAKVVQNRADLCLWHVC